MRGILLVLLMASASLAIVPTASAATACGAWTNIWVTGVHCTVLGVGVPGATVNLCPDTVSCTSSIYCAIEFPRPTGPFCVLG